MKSQSIILWEFRPEHYLRDPKCRQQVGRRLESFRKSFYRRKLWDIRTLYYWLNSVFRRNDLGDREIMEIFRLISACVRMNYNPAFVMEKLNGVLKTGKIKPEQMPDVIDIGIVSCKKKWKPQSSLFWLGKVLEYEQICIEHIAPLLRLGHISGRCGYKQEMIYYFITLLLDHEKIKAVHVKDLIAMVGAAIEGRRDVYSLIHWLRVFLSLGQTDDRNINRCLRQAALKAQRGNPHEHFIESLKLRRRTSLLEPPIPTPVVA